MSTPIDRPEERKSASATVVIIGLPGVGKSTVGRRTAKRLGWEFVDLDTEIESRARMPVRDIFATSGEEGFRALETATLEECLRSSSPAILATGGGVVLDSKNRELLGTARAVIWMTATVADLEQRLKPRTASGRGHRPLLDGDLGQKLKVLLDQREDLYAKVATDVVSTAASTFDEVVDRLVAVVEARVTT